MHRICRKLVRVGQNLEGGVVSLNSIYRHSSTGTEDNHGNLNQDNPLFDLDSKLVACYLYAIECCNLKQTEWAEQNIFRKKIYNWILS